MGTAKYSVWESDSTNLGSEKMNNGDTANYIETISGDYQLLSRGLDLRFAGDTADTATINDYWEIEVHGKYELTDSGMPMSMRATRR